MDVYVLKFSACLFVLWLVYWLLLEKQNSHKFKRFYLLGAIAAALIIPLLTITTYVEPVVSELEVSPAFVPTEYMYVEAPIEEVNSINVVDILWVIYWIGAAIFLTRFIVNLGRLYYKISSNVTVTSNTFIYVLLKNYRIPHSFFKYIFLNKQRYEDQSIPEEVLLHEQTHARQLHSIDIVVLELLHVVLWFHPLIYILKHHVRLNHEFLADEAVINQGTDAKNYQNILLQFSSSTQHHQLASAINYSSFKKRFTVMKTQTSKTKKWLSALLLLPVIAILFYSFAEHVEVVKSEVPNDFLVTVEKNNNTIELRCETGCKWSHITLEPQAKPYIINDYGFTDGATIDSDKFAFTIEPTDIGVELNGLTGTAWIDLAFSLRDHKVQAINQLGMTKFKPTKPKQKENPKTLKIKAINDALFINGNETDVNSYAEALNIVTRDWTSKDYKNTSPALEIEGCSQSFLDKLDAEFRQSHYFIITIEGSKSVDDINDDVVKAYLKKYEVYKKLQDTPPHYIKKSKEDQEKMDKLFSELGGMYFRMSKANKAKVNRPVAPVHPYVKITLKGKTYYKKYEELTKEERATLPPPPPPPPVKKSKGGPNADYDQNEVYNPTFLEYIIEMEALNTTFYLDNKMISSEEAKNIAQNNKGMHTDMLTQKDTNGNFVVKLSSPQQIDVQKGASKEQIKAYNAWAKKINAAMEKAIKNKDVNSYPIIKLKEFEKYKYLYDSVMTDAQRKNAVPFPDKLPPPPPRSEPKKKNDQQSIKIKTLKIDVDKNYALKLNGKPVSLNSLASEAQKINPDLSNNQTMNFVEFSILLPNENYNDIGKKIRSELRKVKIYKGYTGYLSNAEKSGIKSAHYSLNDGLSLDEAKANEDKLVKKLESERDEILKSKGKWSVNYGIESVEYVETNNNSNNVVYKATREFDDLTMRKLILKVSKQQTQPLSYMLNGKKSTASEIEKFLQNNQDADVSFSKGKDSNTLSFSENTGSKMTYDELQALYSSIFKTYNQSLKQIEVRSIKNDKN